MSLTLTLTPARPALLQGFDNQLDVLLQIKAPPKPEGHERGSFNLSVVLDRSGSMQGAPLETARQCALFVQSRLTSNDVISLVTYDDQVSVSSPSSAALPNDHYQAAVKDVETGGTTNLFGGWEAGVGEVKKRAQSYDVNRVLLLSDGCLNAGVTDPDLIKASCLKSAAEGVKTSTYGLGSHFDESVMCMMAEVGGGNTRYGERVEDLLEGFIEELDLLANLYSSELTLTLTPAKGVSVSCLNSLIERKGALILPDLAFGAEVWAGLKLKVTQAAMNSGSPLLTATVHASTSDKISAERVQLETLPQLSATAFDAVSASDAVLKYFAELKVAELKVKASQASRENQWDRVKELIAEMRAQPLTPAQGAEIDELEKLTQHHEAALFSKESLFSVTQSKRSMKQDLYSYQSSSNLASNLGDAQSAPASYLRKKSRWGRSSDDQS